MCPTDSRRKVEAEQYTNWNYSSIIIVIDCPVFIAIYTIGGAEESPDALNDRIYAFDLETLAFSIVGRHPSPALFHDLVLAPGVSLDIHSFFFLRSAHIDIQRVGELNFPI